MVMDKSTLPRRNFLKLGFSVLGTAAALEIGGASLLYLRPEKFSEEFGRVIIAGPVDSFAPGSTTEFPDARFYLIRSRDGGFLAVHNRCPHLGCTVSWQADRQKFHCPCHASSFDGYGDLTNPPVPRPLDTFAISIEENMVQVDTARLQQRDHFSADQLTYA
jgi:cytochrome b6-f complex iron-sulfur subunit